MPPRTARATLLRSPKDASPFPRDTAPLPSQVGRFLTLYLWGKLRPFNGAGSFWKIPVILLPMAGATLVAVTRVTDNRHHWEDVLVGALLGTAFASLGYFLNFPAPWADKAAIPRKRARIAVTPLLTPNQVGMAMQGSF